MVRLETDRLILRQPGKEDAGPIRALLQQEFVRKYNCLGKLPSIAELGKRLTGNPDGQFVICLREEGMVIGHIGLEEDSMRYQLRAFSLDYYLGEAYARRGYMSEALDSVLDYLFAQCGAEIVSARAFTENAASIALLEKLGFVREGTLRMGVRNNEGRVFDDALFSILKSERLMRQGVENRPRLGDMVTIKMDRPIGTVHPKHPGLVYPINYGYVPGLIAPDGEEQDAYVLGVDVPLTEFTGRLIAVIHRFDDVEEKWVLAPEGVSFTKEEIAEKTRFQEQYYHTEIRMEKEPE